MLGCVQGFVELCVVLYYAWCPLNRTNELVVVFQAGDASFLSFLQTPPAWTALLSPEFPTYPAPKTAAIFSNARRASVSVQTIARVCLLPSAPATLLLS